MTSKMFCVMFLIVLVSLIMISLIEENSAAPKRPSAPDVRVLRPEQFGANPLDLEDDTQAFVDMLEAAKLSGSWVNTNELAPLGNIIQLSQGYYLIEGGKLHLNKRHRHLRFVGHGPTAMWGGNPTGEVAGTNSTGRTGPGGTMLVYTGEPGKALISAKGSTAICFDDIAFLGSGKAGYLLRLNSDSGANLSNTVVRNCNFSGADVGISLGDDYGHGADTSAFYEVKFNRCKVGFMTSSDQSLAFLFDHCGAFGCDIAYYFKKGGNALWNNPYGTANEMFFKCDSGGKNAGSFTVNQIRVEPPGDYTILKSRGTADWNFIGGTAVRGSDPDWQGKPMFDIGNRSCLNVVGGQWNRIPFAKIAGSRSGPSIMTVRGARFSKTDIVVTGNGSYLTAEHCFLSGIPTKEFTITNN